MSLMSLCRGLCSATAVALVVVAVLAGSQAGVGAPQPRRFFSDTSVWNTPLPASPAVDPASDRYISLLATEPSGNFGINRTPG